MTEPIVPPGRRTPRLLVRVVSVAFIVLWIPLALCIAVLCTLAVTYLLAEGKSGDEALLVLIYPFALIWLLIGAYFALVVQSRLWTSDE